MKISLVQLRLLEAVAETGSVGAAARRLRLTQSGASQSIATLEKILGIDVLARKRDGAVLTAFGRTILADARTALAAIERIELQARCSASGVPERLRVAAIPSQFEYVLPDLRKRFQRLYPGIDLSGFEGGHDEVSLWVRDGIADLGITSLPTPELEVREVVREELVVVGRRDDPFMRNDTIAARDLRNHQLIAAAGCEMIIDRIIHGDGEMRSEQVRTRDVPRCWKWCGMASAPRCYLKSACRAPTCMDCGPAASIRRRSARSILFSGPTARSGIWSKGSAI